MDNIDLSRKASQKGGFFHRAITTTDNSDRLIFEEKAVTSCAGADASSHQPAFILKPQQISRGSGRDNYGLGLVKIVTEAGIAAGMRRIEAVCGLEALRLVQEEERELSRAAGLLKAGRGELVERLNRVMKRARDLEKQVETLKGRLTTAQAGDLLDQVRKVDGVPVLALEVEAGDPKALREFAAKLSNRLKSGIVVLGSRADDKALLVTIVSKDLTKRFNAGEIIRELAPLVGGSGGGRVDMAQAGGPDKEKLPKAIKQAYEIISQKG